MAGNPIKDEWTTEDGSIRLLLGDCLESLRKLPDECVNCCVTSPPYWGLRDYGHDGQIGLEKTPEEYVARMVEVFRGVRRVLKDDGTLWLNLGDSYNGIGGPGKQDGGPIGPTAATAVEGTKGRRINGLKPKDLVGIPWRVAFALQADGWWLRQDIIWAKPNPMPESVTDRCTKAHEYVFLLSKSAKYWYDAEAVSEMAIQPTGSPIKVCQHKQAKLGANLTGTLGANCGPETRNRRSVWQIATQPYSGAHFAVMPSDLVEPCILAGCPEGGTVLDPFAGSGTVAQVAIAHGRQTIACELNPSYGELIQKRIRDELDKTRLIEPPKNLVQRSFVEGA